MAKQQQSQAKPHKKRKLSSTLLWGGLGLLILVLGAASAYYYMNRERLQSDTRLKVIQDFVDKIDTTLGKGKEKIAETLQKGKTAARKMARMTEETMKPPPPAPPGAFQGPRSHVVKEGENLWAIAREGSLVDSPWEWGVVVAQNKDKIDYAFISDENGGSWKVIMPKGQELRTTSANPFAVTGPIGKRYAIQLVSLPQTAFKRGVALVKILLRDGFYAYLYRADVKGEAVSRVRSGFYETEAQANQVAREIQAKYASRGWFQGTLWVMVPSQKELRGETLMFGAQRINPWVIELSRRDTQEAAWADLRKASGVGEFVYISQRRNKETGRFVYRTRLGFYTSEKQARKILDARKGAVWNGAKVVPVGDFEESFPGQRLKLGKADS